MKNTFNFTTRFAATALAAGAICFATPLFAQEDQANEQGGQSESATSTESTTTTGSDAHGTSAAKGGSTSKTGSSVSKAMAHKNNGTASGPVTSPVTKQDQQFLQTAAKDGMKEVEMGKMAQQHGQSAQVKHLGQMMVTDHTQANSELMAVAQKHAVKLDTKAPAAANMPSGGSFDQQWLTEMIPAHERAISLFQTEAKQGSNSEITGFAATTLPTLQKHLRELQAAQGKNGGTTSSANGWRRKNT